MVLALTMVIPEGFKFLEQIVSNEVGPNEHFGGISVIKMVRNKGSFHCKMIWVTKTPLIV